MDFLAAYGLFFLKTFTLVIAILLLLVGIISLNRRQKPKIELIDLNQHWNETKQLMEKTILGAKAAKKIKEKKRPEDSPVLFLIDFAGDIKASQVEQLRDEVSAVLSIAKKHDEVFIRIDSPGGAVNGYGLAASQLQRIRDRKIPLTAGIDKVAASGGYLMASVANKIIAAPFAIIGSIGVVAQFPNFHRWLKKHDIDVEILTAGEYKRTLTLFGENTAKGRDKFREDLEKIHASFREYVLQNREKLNIEEVATGEHWLATDALELKLIDVLKTSDDYLQEKLQTHQIYQVLAHAKTSIAQKLLKPAAQLLHPW